MEPHIWVWVWVIVAVVTLVAEILSPGLYALPFTLGAGTAALLEITRPGSVTWQWAAFFGISSVVFVAGQRVLGLVRRRDEKTPAE